MTLRGKKRSKRNIARCAGPPISKARNPFMSNQHHKQYRHFVFGVNKDTLTKYQGMDAYFFYTTDDAAEVFKFVADHPELFSSAGPFGTEALLIGSPEDVLNQPDTIMFSEIERAIRLRDIRDRDQ